MARARKLCAQEDRAILIAYVEGKPVGYAEAQDYGDSVWRDFSVVRLLPVAVAADGRNFFEAEGALEAAGKKLRPGMRGVAKIAAGRRSAAWIATHRLFDWLRLTAWSLGA